MACGWRTAVGGGVANASESVARGWLWLAVALALGACAVRGSRTEPVDSPDRVALVRLQAGGPAKLAVGDAQPDGTQRSLEGMTQALHGALIRDLGAIGVLDAAAPTRVGAVVLRSASGIEALITVTRAGQTRLRKRYPLDGPGEPSDPAGAIRPLLGLLYSDPEFDLSLRP